MRTATFCSEPTFVQSRKDAKDHLEAGYSVVCLRLPGFSDDEYLEITKRIWANHQGFTYNCKWIGGYEGSDVTRDFASLFSVDRWIKRQEVKAKRNAQKLILKELPIIRQVFPVLEPAMKTKKEPVKTRKPSHKIVRYEGVLEIDTRRGVIYFHSNKGATVLRICQLTATDKDKLRPFARHHSTTSIDITLGHGVLVTE